MLIIDAVGKKHLVVQPLSGLETLESIYHKTYTIYNSNYVFFPQNLWNPPKLNKLELTKKTNKRVIPVGFLGLMTAGKITCHFQL